MSNQRINIAVTGDAAAKVADLAAKVDDPQPALRKVGQAIRASEVQVFATSGGGTWDPLNPSTIKKKGSSRILVDTGALEKSLTGSGKGSITRVSKTQVFIGTSNPNAALQRSGARGHPKRDPVPKPNAATLNRWAQVFVDALTEDLDSGG